MKLAIKTGISALFGGVLGWVLALTHWFWSLSISKWPPVFLELQIALLPMLLLITLRARHNQKIWARAYSGCILGAIVGFVGAPVLVASRKQIVESIAANPTEIYWHFQRMTEAVIGAIIGAIAFPLVWALFTTKWRERNRQE